MEIFSLQKVVEMLEEMVVSWWEIRWIWWTSQYFLAHFVQLLKCWLCNMRSGGGVEKNWVPSVDQCCLQALQFSVNLMDLLSILLRCNGFSGITKIVVDQKGSRQRPWPFFGASLALGSALELLSPVNELAVTSCYIKSTFCHRSQSDWKMVHCCIE